jgi:glycosyltransferase involved in cell wall biosynthesis
MGSVNLSVIVPVYNEESFIGKQLDRILTALPKDLSVEVIVINDGSVDSTADVLRNYHDRCFIIDLHENRGKGFAVKRGILESRGEVILIIDADLEYSPKEAMDFVPLIFQEKSSAIYGNRMHRKNPIGHRRYYLGNLLLSALASLLYGRVIRDVETGCKIFRKIDINPEELKEDGFGIEIEITAQLLKRGVAIKQPAISYSPRRFTEGKKINWRDGLSAVYLLIKLRF